MASGLKILNKYSFSTQAAKLKIEKIIRLLSEKELSRRDLSEQVHLAYRHTKTYIDYLLLTKQIYISVWKLEAQGERTMSWPYYRAGDKKSKPKPDILTVAEKCKRYRKKLKKDDDRKEKANLRRRAKRITIKPDWTAAWLMASNSTTTNDAGA